MGAKYFGGLWIVIAIPAAFAKSICERPANFPDYSSFFTVTFTLAVTSR